MPKKPPRNAFYFFMVDFKEQQRKKGINYANMAEVAEAAGPAWKSAPPPVRAKFEGIAKAEKSKANVPEKKYTSTGVSLADIEAAERARQDAAAAELKDITNFVKQKSIDGSILDEDFVVMDVNVYCRARGTYVVGECALLRFSIRDGIKNTYHQIINPGCVPMGFALDVKESCKELGLPGPDEDSRPTDLVQLLAASVDFLRGGAGGAAGGSLPAMYTLPDKVPPVVDFLDQMCSRAAEDTSIFRVYRLDLLLHQLSLAAAGELALPRESLALAMLKRDPFKYTPGLACEMHEEADRAIECCSARVKRWAFTVLDHVCARLTVTMLPGHHLPAGTDLSGILSYKECIRGPAPHLPPSLNDTGNMLDESCCSTNTDASVPAAAAAAASRRTHVPLRMPQADYSQEFRLAPALQLQSDDEFPALSGGGGRGRGRKLAASFGKMKM